MASTGGANTAVDGLVFGYDTGYPLVSGNSDTYKFNRGEPTTNNYGNDFKDFSGTSYAPDNQWAGTVVTKTYISELPTPIGTGATLMTEATSSGYQGLSRYGGGGETGAHTLSAFVYPLTDNINNFSIGLLGDGGNHVFFDFTTNSITYGNGITNRNAIIKPVPGYPGWYRVGANFEGRNGGWVGSIGYGMNQQYAGSGTLRSMYITGIQYEFKAHITPFTTGTRSATQSLIDLTRTSTIDISNASFDNNSQIVFDGTDDYINIPHTSTHSFTGNFSIEAVIFPTSNTANCIIQKGSGNDYFQEYWVIQDMRGSNKTIGLIMGKTGNTSANYITTGNISVLNTYHHIIVTITGTTSAIYVNGKIEATGTISNRIQSTSDLRIGRRVDGFAATSGKIPITKIYNRALTSQEVQQNYNAVKERFNL
jgi:hypothetical protein